MTENSGTLVLDPATMAKTLTRLRKEIGNGKSWKAGEEAHPNYPLQERLLKWYDQNWDKVEMLEGLKTEASTSDKVLNQFLTDNGFEPMFRPIPPGCWGAAAILDMLVSWAVKASLTSLTTLNADYSRTEHTAFEIPEQGFEIFDVLGQPYQLVKIHTLEQPKDASRLVVRSQGGTQGLPAAGKKGGAVWLIMADRPQHGLDLVDLAVKSMATRTPADSEWISSVVVPTLEIDAKVNLDWMLGVHAGSQLIDQAFQIFKLRMNQEGARVKAATGFATRESLAPKPLLFDSPFTGWFTQADSEIPIAAFYADEDSWKFSGKTLEDM